MIGLSTEEQISLTRCRSAVFKPRINKNMNATMILLQKDATVLYVVSYWTGFIPWKSLDPAFKLSFNKLRYTPVSPY